MAGRNCTICSSPHGAAIDVALANGARLVPTAAQFGVSKSAMGRHKTNCLAPRLAAAAQTVAGSTPVRQARAVLAGQATTSLADIGTAQGLTSKIAETLERLEYAAELACVRSQYSSLAAVSAQILRGIESAAKLHGLYADASASGEVEQKFQINIVVNAPADARPAAIPATVIEGAARPVWRPLEEAKGGALPVPSMRLDFGEPFTLGPMPDHVAGLRVDRDLTRLAGSPA